VDSKWYLKITNLETQEIVTDQTITDADLVVYLDTLEDDNDLLLRDFQDQLFIVSKKRDVEILQEGPQIVITFFGLNSEILGVPGEFEVMIGFLGQQADQLVVGPEFTTRSSSASDVLGAYKNGFNSQLSDYLESITIDSASYKLTLTLKENVGATIEYKGKLLVDYWGFEAEDVSNLDPLHYESSGAYVIIDYRNTYTTGRQITMTYTANGTTDTIDITASASSIETLMENATNIKVNAIEDPADVLTIYLPAKFTNLNQFTVSDTDASIYITMVDDSGNVHNDVIPPQSSNTTLNSGIGWVPMRAGRLNFKDVDNTYMIEMGINIHKWGESDLVSIVDDIPVGKYTTLDSILTAIDTAIDDYAILRDLSSSELYADKYSTYVTIFVRHDYYFDMQIEESAPSIELLSIDNKTFNFSMFNTSFPIQYDWVNDTIKRFIIEFGKSNADVFFLFPYIVEAPIVDLMFYQNRLVFITERALLASRTGRFSQFYPDNPDVMLESDPILLLIAQAGDKLQAMIPFSESILLIGNREQYTLYHQGFMTFANLTLLPATSYTLGPARPIKAGSEVFFSNNNQQYSRVLKYIVQPNTQIKTSYELTTNIPKYIPKDISKLIYLDSLDILVAFTKESPSTLYVLQQAYQGDQQVQLAWHKWTFEYPIVNIEKGSKDLLYIMFDLGEILGVSKMDLISEKPKFYLDLWSDATVVKFTWYSDQPSTELEIEYYPLLQELGAPVSYVLKDTEGNYLEGTSDNFTYTGVPFESYIELLPWILRNSNGQPVTDGRLQLRQLELIFTDTWYLKVVNTPMGRPEYYREYQNLTLDGYEIPGGYNQDTLGTIFESRGTLKLYVGGQANKTNLKITSGDSMWRMGILGYTLFGNWQQFSKWSQGTSMGNGGV
jgi:hypothetical protein